MKLKFSELMRRAEVVDLSEKEVWKSSCKEITLLSKKAGIIIKTTETAHWNSVVLSSEVEYELQNRPKTLTEILKIVKEKCNEIKLTLNHDLLEGCVSASDDFDLKKLKNKTPMYFDVLINTLENQFTSDDLAQILLEAEWFIEE